MVDFKLAIVSLVLFGLVSTEAKYRQKRQTWRNVPTFHVSDGKPVNQSPPAKKPAHDPPPPPPPNPKGGATDPWGTGGLNWNFGMGSSGMNTGMGSGGTGGNTAGASSNRWDHPPQNMWQPPPPPPPSNHQTQRNNHPPPPPPNHWNHMPPPPPNHWHHPPPPPQNHWAPPPPPPPPQPKAASGGSSMAGALASLQQQMQMSMLTAGIDTPDARKFNPAPIEILQYTCPIELPIKQCLINPCPTRCKRYPLAKCYTNPCGNCSPEWIQNNMKIIDCD